jgi:hypothetical protein
MSKEEKQDIRQSGYTEALRYMDNARKTLEKAGREDDRFYKDPKYVRTACGTAYNGVLHALDTFLVLRGVIEYEPPRKFRILPKRRKSIEFYREHTSKQDRKLLNLLNSVYEVLHLSGYYDGILDSHIVKSGFTAAYGIIDYIKPG